MDARVTLFGRENFYLRGTPSRSCSDPTTLQCMRWRSRINCPEAAHLVALCKIAGKRARPYPILQVIPGVQRKHPCACATLLVVSGVSGGAGSSKAGWPRPRSCPLSAQLLRSCGSGLFRVFRLGTGGISCYDSFRGPPVALRWSGYARWRFHSRSEHFRSPGFSA
jgi:hypothetical protein